AKAMRDRAGVAGAHLLYDALRRELASPQWTRALDRGLAAPGLLVSTRPMAGPDRGAEYARQCLLPGAAVALAPGALRSFADDDSAPRTSTVDLAEARRVVGILDWFGISLHALPGPATPSTPARCHPGRVRTALPNERPGRCPPHLPRPSPFPFIPFPEE